MMKLDVQGWSESISSGLHCTLAPKRGQGLNAFLVALALVSVSAVFLSAAHVGGMDLANVLHQVMLASADYLHYQARLVTLRSPGVLIYAEPLAALALPLMFVGMMSKRVLG